MEGAAGASAEVAAIATALGITDLAIDLHFSDPRMSDASNREAI